MELASGPGWSWSRWATPTAQIPTVRPGRAPPLCVSLGSRKHRIQTSALPHSLVTGRHPWEPSTLTRGTWFFVLSYIVANNSTQHPPRTSCHVIRLLSSGHFCPLHEERGSQGAKLIGKRKTKQSTAQTAEATQAQRGAACRCLAGEASGVEGEKTRSLLYAEPPALPSLTPEPAPTAPQEVTSADQGPGWFRPLWRSLVCPICDSS